MVVNGFGQETNAADCISAWLSWQTLQQVPTWQAADPVFYTLLIVLLMFYCNVLLMVHVLVLLTCFTLTDAMYNKRFTQELISAWQESFVTSAMRPLPTTKVPVLVPSNKTPVVSASPSGSSPRREDTSTRRSTKPLVYFFFNQLHGAGSRVERCTTTHTKDARATSTGKTEAVVEGLV